MLEFDEQARGYQTRFLRAENRELVQWVSQLLPLGGGEQCPEQKTRNRHGSNCGFVVSGRTLCRRGHRTLFCRRRKP